MASLEPIDTPTPTSIWAARASTPRLGLHAPVPFRSYGEPRSPASRGAPASGHAVMPVLKNLAKLKVPVGGTEALILPSTNPFMPGSEEEEANTRLPNGDVREQWCQQRRATLERLVGLSPFRKKGPERGSFLGRLLLGPEAEPSLRVPEHRKPRRRSEDFSLLQCRKPSLGEAERDSPGDTLRRMAFLKLGRGAWPRRASLADQPRPAKAPEPGPVAEELESELDSEPVAEAKEPLSVLEILELIQRRDLLAADTHILELEAECERAEDGGRQAKDVELLYEALLRQLWALLAEALQAPGPYIPLALLVGVLEQEELADQRWLVARGSGGLRPRALRERWAKAVAQAVGERLGQCAKDAPEALPARLDRLAQCAVRDLRALRCYQLGVYPPAYGAFGIYARSYHHALAQHLAALARQPLSIADLYALLQWHCNTYHQVVLGQPDIAPLLSAEELGPLLPLDTQHSLEEACLSAVEAKIMAELARELQADEEQWGREPGSKDVRESLSSRVITVLQTHVDRAPQITPEFGARMARGCLASLASFLQSFQRKVERFHAGQGEGSPPADAYLDRTIALVNCCPPFRAFVEQLGCCDPPESKDTRGQASACLDRVSQLCQRALAQRLLEDLKPYFNKLMKHKWLTSSEAFDTIITLFRDYAQRLCRMRPEPYQELVAELHRRVLVEYVRPLLQVRIVCTSAKMRARLAAKLSDEARQLQDLFSRLESTASWLNAAVPHLADIVGLEDTASVQMEVGLLVRDFPDVRRKHVVALLDVRGLRSPALRHEILAVLEDVEKSGATAPPPRRQAFFAEIPAARARPCLRLAPTRLACLPSLRWLRPNAPHSQA
ncbi:exocyst complex component 3-like protein 2 isoform X3 [Alligator mississippiensis]|nr:exocyst complex component 3-like protein 2 isoform X3 [Alligator mississippiensis]XP_059575141.1 exocyst complex component 3-like protein 2 isoform X3 [Alligator mississippiensis]